MMSHRLSTIQLQRLLRTCIYVALLCAFFGVVADTRAQLTINDACAALDMSADNCSQIRSISFAPPDLPWQTTPATSVAGGSSLRSGDIGDDQQSCIVLELPLPANSVISVAARSSSQGGFDQLQIAADQLRLDTLSAPVDQIERDWRQQSYFLPATISTLRWCYAKDSATRSGEDRVWIDNLSFSTSNISYQSRVCDALDLTENHCSLIQSIRYEPPELLWIITSVTSVAGGSSLRSGDIGDLQQSCIVLEVSLPVHSVISVAARTSSQGSFDQLLIHADQLRLDSISAPVNLTERDWRQQGYSRPSTITTLRWCYAKDFSGSEGQDAAWIDNLSFSDVNDPSNIPLSTGQVCLVLDMSADDCSQIRSVSFEPPDLFWQITSATAVAGGSSLRSGKIGDLQQSCIVLEVSLPVHSVISVAARSSSQGGFDQLQIAADPLRLDTLSASVGQTERDWRQQSYFLPATITTLRWCYAKDSATRSGEDRVWIDNLSFSTSNISYQSRVCDALDLTENHCSLLQSIRYEPPELLWIITSVTSVAGGSSMRSGDIGDLQQSCIVLEVSLPVHSVISVAARTSSQGSFDQLQIQADQLRLDSISAPVNLTERDWRQQGYSRPSTITTLRWCYAKDFSGSEGQDAAWIDNLSFSDVNDPSNIPLSTGQVCLVLDMSADDCSQIRSVSFEPPDLFWQITSATAVAGGSSLRSGKIGDLQQSCIVLEVSLPVHSVISVAARSSSQGLFDQLQIQTDQLRLDTIFAPVNQTERDWRQQSYFLPAAITALRGCYAKSFGVSEGQDAAWIDKLSFSTSNISYQSRICAALDLTEDRCSLIQSIRYEPPELLWIITSATSVAGGSSMRSGYIGDDQQSCIVLELSLPVHSVISVAARTSSWGRFDRLLIHADQLRIDTISAETIRIFSAPVFQSERDWRQQGYFLPAPISTLRWCYAKRFAISLGQDAAWIDNLSFSTSNISYQNRICAALDLTEDRCSLIQSIRYEPPESLWIITSVTFVAGGSSLRSADIDHNQSTCIVLELTLPANSMLSVAARTSSQGGFDQLQIQADRLRLNTISAPVFQTERDWRQQSYFLPATITTLRWCYARDNSITQGQDAAWIDKLSFSAAGDLLLSIERVCLVLDMSTDDCSQIRSVSFDPPDLPWQTTPATAVAGGSSLRSGDVGDSQQSCLVLEVTLPVHSAISVAGRSSSQGGMDQLLMHADRLRIDTLSAPVDQIERDWRQQSYFLPTAISTLRWCYTKDNSGNRGQDAAWIDNLSFSTSNISYQSRICAALDLTESRCSMVQSIRYEPPELLWIITSVTSVAGGSSMRSGYIGSRQQSCIVLELSLPVNSVLSVAARTSSEGGFDQLLIQADQLLLDTISAAGGQTERDWRQQSYLLPATISTLRWCYTKDFSSNRGQDAVWIDNLSFSTSNISYQSRICAALDLTENHCSMIQSIRYEPPESLWIITSQTSVAGSTSLRSGEIGSRQQSCIVLEVSLPVHSVISVAARSSSQGGFDQLQIQADRLRLDTLSAPADQTERDWRQQSYFLPATITALRWCYTKDNSGNRGQDAAWIDKLSFSTSNISYPSRICAALDLTARDCSMIQSVTYNPPELLWIITSQTSVAGGSSLRSGAVDRNQSTCIVLEVSLPVRSVISVAARSSSQGLFDQLQIQADRLRIDTLSAPADQIERDWRQQDYFLPATITTLRWCYTKDNSGNRGQDAAWIDKLSFSTSNISYQSRICAALDLTARDCSMIQSVTYNPPESLWIITSQTSVAGGSSLRSGAVGDSQQSCIVLELTLPVHSMLSVAARTRSEGGFDRLLIHADPLLLDTISAAGGQTERDWRQQSYLLPAAISTLRWCYTKNFSRSEGQDAAWIDNLSFSDTGDLLLSIERVCLVLDMSADDCSQIRSVSFDPPDLPWQTTPATSVAGGSSLHSGDVDDGQQSCIVLEVALPVHSVISVAARTSSRGGVDQLRISADQLRLDTLSAPVDQIESDWRQQSYFLPTAITALRWCYTKDNSGSEGQDAAWIDNLSFSTSNISYQSRICAALDLTNNNCSLIQSITYNPPQLLWIITSQTSVAGRTSLRSGDIDDNQQSCLVLGLSLPVNSMLTVSGRTSSEGGFDQLQIDADNLRLDTLSAPESLTERDWRQESYFLPTAISTLSWCYAKDISLNDGQDAVWIDSLSFSTSNISYQSRICAALDLTENNCSLIQSLSYEPPQLLWIITSQTSVAGGTSLRSGAVDADQQSCIVLGVSLPTDYVVSVAARTSSEGGFDQLQIDADNLRFDTISAPLNQTERDWRQESYTLPAAISTLSWCYEKDESENRGQDAAWIDALAFIAAETAPLCDALDLSVEFCANIQSVTYNPPQNRWQTTTSTDSLVGASALVTPPLDAGQSACLVIELVASLLPPGSQLIFSWRTTAASDQDLLRFEAGSQQRQISDVPEWQTEYIELDSLVTTLSWCYSKNSSSDSQSTRAWLDNLVLVTPADRYRIQLAVTGTPTRIASQTDTFRYRVEVRAESPLLPPPLDWVLLVGGIDNIAGTDSTFALSFDSSGATEVVVFSTPDDPYLPATVLLSLVDRPSFAGAVATSLRYALPPFRTLAALQILVPSTVTQTVVAAPIEIAVAVAATDNFGDPVQPAGLMLNVAAVDNLNVLQSSYALSFDGGLAQTTVTVELITGGISGSLEVAVISGEVNATALVFIDPAPPVLASITLSAASSSLVQTLPNTPAVAELILTALDNYGNPIGVGNVSLQLSASFGAIVQTTLTAAIEASGSARQAVEILPQNDLDTTATVQILRGTLDEAVQLLPEGGIQIAVRAARRVLRQLQLSLAGAQSPLRQIDPSLPIRANIRLTGLDQFGQPSAFPEVILSVAAEPTTTEVTLNPQRLSATGLQGAQTQLKVVFPDDNPMDTTITIAIASPGTGVTVNELVVRALPDRRLPTQNLNIDNADPRVTELDLIVALRWLTDQQSSTQSLVANLTITSTGVMTAGIDNLRQLFTDPDRLDRIDLNGDRRADQLDLRILLRHESGAARHCPDRAGGVRRCHPPAARQRTVIIRQSDKHETIRNGLSASPPRCSNPAQFAHIGSGELAFTMARLCTAVVVCRPQFGPPGAYCANCN